jgi:hypothetical protein
MPNRSKKAARRKPGTGKPTPGKDRTVHEAARGVKLSPDELPKTRLTDVQMKIREYRKFIRAESDRGAVMMASTLVEQELQALLSMRLPNFSDAELADWFGGETSPFRTFSAKIKLGRALGIYKSDVEGELNLIRKFRNLFAHTSVPLDLGHASLKPMRDQLLSHYDEIPVEDDKARFCGYCLSVAIIVRELAKRDWTLTL